MATLELTVRLVAGLLLILVNAFFVAIEFALTRVRQYPEAEFDTPRLRQAWEMTDDLEIYLTSCQVGITASSIALGIVAEPALAGLFEPLVGEVGWLAAIGGGGLLAFLLLNLVHLTHGEQTPTYLGVERSKLVASYGSRPLRWFTLAILPVIKLGDKVAKATLALFGVRMTGSWLETGTEAISSRAELRTRLSSVLEQGQVPDDRRREVLAALDLGDQPVSEIMVPVEDMVSLSTEASTQENLATMAAHGHTRYPLLTGGRGQDAQLAGIVYVPAVLTELEALREGRLDLGDVAAPPMELSATAPVSEAIDAFQSEGQEMALVVGDEGIQGLVTATDALEAVVGDLEDPLDRASGDR